MINMPRGRRINVVGGIYHVITRGIERRCIFNEDSDKQHFIDRFKDALTNNGCKCYAWVLMPNHIHLLIKVLNGSLSDLMRSLLTGYALYFNRRYHRNGHLFQNRYKSVLCQEDIYLKKLVAYIHLNPLKARIVESLSALENYKWCGHGELVGKIRRRLVAVDDVLKYFGETISDARKYYKEYLNNNIYNELGNELMGGGLIRSAGGWMGVENLKRLKIRWHADERILGDSTFVDEVLKNYDETVEVKDRLKRDGWDLNKLANTVCELLSLDKNDLFKKGRTNLVSAARCLICYWGHTYIGIKGVDIARFLGVSGAAITKSIKLGSSIATKKHLS